VITPVVSAPKTTWFFAVNQTATAAINMPLTNPKRRTQFLLIAILLSAVTDIRFIYLGFPFRTTG
jgi:hypothetical protein